MLTEEEKKRLRELDEKGLGNLNEEELEEFIRLSRKSMQKPFLNLI